MPRRTHRSHRHRPQWREEPTEATEGRALSYEEMARRLVRNNLRSSLILEHPMPSSRQRRDRS